MVDSTDFPHLPEGFEFGASTASYQIEGATNEDGRGTSIWDTFCAEPGRIVDGSSGEVACDHYHRYAEDVALMKGLGLDGYRFSIAWPRIQPEGSGKPSRKGLDFYDRLIDELLAKGIKPMATLFHWDLPQTLEDKGGWLNRDTAQRFAEYAILVGMRFADRVEHWIPVNEPNVVTMLGYALGMHAPGRQLMFDALPVAHHLLLAHGQAVNALRAVGAKSIGTANNHTPVWAASSGDEDKEAANAYATLWNRLFADPMLRGAYPEGFDALMPGPVAEDLKTIGAPLDFYGVNYYNPTRVAGPNSDLPSDEGAPAMEGLPFRMVPVEGYPRTDFGWPVVAPGPPGPAGDDEPRVRRAPATSRQPPRSSYSLCLISSTIATSPSTGHTGSPGMPGGSCRRSRSTRDCSPTSGGVADPGPGSCATSAPWADLGGTTVRRPSYRR